MKTVRQRHVSTPSQSHSLPRWPHMSRPEWLLLFLLLLAPLYFHPNMGGTGLRLPNNIVIWLSAGLFGFYMLYQLTSQQRFYLPRHYLLLLAFPVFAFFSGIVSGVEIPAQWTFRILYIWGGVLFFFALFQTRFHQARIDRILLFIVISGFLHALMGLAQIIWLKALPHWLPINPHGVPTGLFQQINVQASFQTTVLFISFWLLTRPILRKHAKWRTYFVITTLLCATFIIGYSGSRVAMLGFLLALPLFLASRWPIIKCDRRLWMILALLMSMTLFAAHQLEQARGLTSALDKAAAIHAGFSGSARLGIYQISLDLIKEKPIFGHGIGSFPRVWQFAKPAFLAAHPDAVLPTQRVAHPHNEILFWLVEGGIVAVIGLALFILGVFLSLHALPACRRYAYAAMLLPIALHTQVELPFYISALHWFVFLLLLFIVCHPTRRSYRLILSSAARISLKVLAIGSAIVLTLFMAHSMRANLEFKRFVTHKSILDHPPFSVALHNPYFKELAAQTLMTSLLFSSMKYHIDDNVRLFVNWSKKALKTNPHILYFRLTTRALIYLKDDHSACTIARRGQQIYPDDPLLRGVIQKCQNLGINQ